MVHSLHLDNDLLQDLRFACKDEQFMFGLLIGSSIKQGSNTQSHVAHWCFTSGMDGEDQPQSLDQLEISLIVLHACQTVRMLPGGVQVLGVCIASAEPSPSSSKLRNILTHIHRSALVPYAAYPEQLPDLLAFTVSPSTLQYSCQAFKYKAQNAPPENVDVKDESVEWRELRYMYNLDETLHITADKDYRKQMDNITRGVASWATRRVSRSLVVIGNRLCAADDSRPLAVVCPGAETLECQVLERCGDARSLSNATYALTLTGNVAGVACVPVLASVSDAVAAVTSDLFRNVVTRFVLNCGMGLNFTVKETQQLPCRIFCRVPGVPVAILDYQFPDDTNEETYQTLADVLAIDVPQDEIDIDYRENWLDMTVSGPISARQPVQTLSAVQLQLAALLMVLAVVLACLYLSV